MILDTVKNALIIGLGTSGIATARFLCNRGLTVFISESRKIGDLNPLHLTTLKKLGVEIETEGHTEKFLDTPCLVIPSPGVPLDLPILQKARDKGYEVIGELALLEDITNVPVIAITGTNGKTTVTSLIGHLLKTSNKKVFVGGNIGTAVLDFFIEKETPEFIVLEVSSFQLDIAKSFHPNISILLNISPDHLDRHGTLNNYILAKQKIFTNQTGNDIAIIGADDPDTTAAARPTKAKLLRFGESSSYEATTGNQKITLSNIFDGDDSVETYDLSKSNLSSKINCSNTAAAVLAVRSLGCSKSDIQRGLNSFTPPSHRMELVAEHNNIRWINDSKATNIGAVAAALSNFNTPVILIAGGRNKGCDFTLLEEAVQEHVKEIFLIGEASQAIDEAFGHLIKSTRVETLYDAVEAATLAAFPGDTILLAPGCASFDMFSGYAQRGLVFQQAVSSVLKKLSPTDKKTQDKVML